ncbi:E3 ubiquitin-protein ligase LRSAM1-like [Watersipora subatra]|uniref:E3 ubiquitin-protein ligase LRSAM1-like n=1 Tax=Watersipora subatra TaxID=2589382 RepID=UPI00355C68C2
MMGRKSSKKVILSKKVQHQIWVANESPEPTYDLSDCELIEVPEGVFSSCKVLRKEALILHSNSLSSLTDNNNRIESLSTLLVMDLHSNKLSQLPSSIQYLTNLQVLNVSHNALTSIPAEIKSLKSLQTLNLSDNKLSKLPQEMGRLSFLRSLNIASNQIHKLPVNLCHVSTLESLTLDVAGMRYPDRLICDGGIEAIMRTLCKDGGVEYVPPSKAVLPLLVPSNKSPAANPDIAHLHPDHVPPALQSYEEMKRKKHEQNLLLEKDAQEASLTLNELLRTQQEKKHSQIASLAQDNKQCEDTIASLQLKHDQDRQRLFNMILEDDSRATALIDEIFRRNAEGKEKADLLQELEDERERELANITIKNEELSMLRKEEMMSRMADALHEMQGFDEQIERYMRDREDAIKSAQKQFLDEDQQISSTLTKKGTEQHNTVQAMLNEENWQRAALESLMKQKDERHSQLTLDISSLEKQLARLTIVEMANKMSDNKAKQDMLTEQREHLTRLLQLLMDKRDLRSKEIAKRMVEMETARDEDLADYWLAQMQRLLDRKPQAQIDRESQLEFSVVDILSMAGADDYVPRFAQHKVSIETMKSLTDDDLRRMGVHEIGVRKSILKNTLSYLEKVGELPTSDSSGKVPEAASSLPSAPSTNDLGARSSSASAPLEVLAHVTTECVICLDRQTGIVFLPCGHVCCCLDCCQSLFNCPMCRSEISQKIILET